jgi:autotransporter-associated beta strand protein
VTVGGTSPSTISTGNNKGNHLLPAGTTFNVGDVTAGTGPSLIVSAPLLNSSGDYPDGTNTVPGVAGFTKTGAGIMSLTAVNTYTGPTTVNAGTLAVNGSITSPVTVNSGGTLAGSGTVSQAVTVNSGGKLAPGNSPGVLTVAGPVTFLTGSTFAVQLNGNTPGNTATNHSQLVVSGAATSLDLGGSTLSGTLGYTPAPGPTGDKLFIAVLTDPLSTVLNTFNGVPQDGVVTLGTYTAHVSYTGDSASGNLTGGNDVVVYNFTPVPEPTTAAVFAAVGLYGVRRVRRRTSA